MHAQYEAASTSDLMGCNPNSLPAQSCVFLLGSKPYCVPPTPRYVCRELQSCAEANPHDYANQTRLGCLLSIVAGAE